MDHFLVVRHAYESVSSSRVFDQYFPLVKLPPRVVGEDGLLINWHCRYLSHTHSLGKVVPRRNNNRIERINRIGNSMPADPLPVPAQLEAQLNKCKSVRSAEDSYKSRTKTAKVRATDSIVDSSSSFPSIFPHPLCNVPYQL